MIVQIGEPNFIASPNAQRVKELLYEGKSISQIASIMHQGYEAIEDWIYEVRKEQTIMANKLTNEQRAEIYCLWKEGGKSQTDIARKFNVSATTVSLIIKKMNGVQDMVNTLSAADAESAQTSQSDWRTAFEPIRQRIEELTQQRNVIDRELDDIYDAMYAILMPEKEKRLRSAGLKGGQEI